ncbi:MAG: hypothetical protein IPP46_01120 [Bacteroidetes bacterium]|nr:hypothetical protein [Bacteroidota bacterium]
MMLHKTEEWTAPNKRMKHARMETENKAIERIARKEPEKREAARPGRDRNICATTNNFEECRQPLLRTHEHLPQNKRKKTENALQGAQKAETLPQEKKKRA